jgi:hypothetical protein
VTVARPQAAKPIAPLAVLVKLLAVIEGPGGMDVRLAVAVSPPALAVTTMGPACAPAVTVVEARPVASVLALAGFTVALPDVTANVTAVFGTTFPPASFATKATGCPKGCPTTAVCPPPVARVKLVTRTLFVKLNF